MCRYWLTRSLERSWRLSGLVSQIIEWVGRDEASTWVEGIKKHLTLHKGKGRKWYGCCSCNTCHIPVFLYLISLIHCFLFYFVILTFPLIADNFTFYLLCVPCPDWFPLSLVILPSQVYLFCIFPSLCASSYCVSSVPALFLMFSPNVKSSFSFFFIFLFGFLIFTCSLLDFFFFCLFGLPDHVLTLTFLTIL